MGAVHVDASDAAVQIIERAKASRAGQLTITIGTGCCESTAPFLYEDFWPGPDQAVVGEVAGVQVFAPEYLRTMYPEADGVSIDVFVGPAESMSIETEWDCRLYLRGQAVDDGRAEVCEAPAVDEGPGLLADRPVGSFVTGELPEQLKHLRMR